MIKRILQNTIVNYSSFAIVQASNLKVNLEKRGVTITPLDAVNK